MSLVLYMQGGSLSHIQCFKLVALSVVMELGALVSLWQTLGNHKYVAIVCTGFLFVMHVAALIPAIVNTVMVDPRGIVKTVHDYLLITSREGEMTKLKSVLGYAITQLTRFNIDKQGHVLVDTSTNRESRFVVDHYSANHADTAVCKMVVDIGAAEGVLGSNSYLFSQMGYQVLLVEPDPVNQKTISENLLPLFPSTLQMLKGAVGAKRGQGKFFRSADQSFTSGSLVEGINDDRAKYNARFKTVGSFDVEIYAFPDAMKGVRERCGEQNMFLMATIDAEGMEETILKMVSQASQFPLYIIYEWSRKAKIQGGIYEHETGYIVPGYKEAGRMDNNIVLERILK